MQRVLQRSSAAAQVSASGAELGIGSVAGMTLPGVGVGTGVAVGTGAGTGSFADDMDFGLYTEFQVGSYAVMDTEYLDIEQGAGPRFTAALFVEATVICTQFADFVLVDAGFNDLMRPAMYGAHHAITAIDARGPLYRGHAAVDLARRGMTFESVAVKNVHVLGDSIQIAPAMPKTSLSKDEVKAMLLLACERIIAAEPMLSQADRDLGDGDHGMGMERGMRAATEKLNAGEPESIEKAFSNVGMAMMSSMGGASGAIFGTFFRNGGKALNGKESFDAAGLAAFLQAGVDGVKQRGGAAIGDKTCVDAMEPAATKAAEVAAQSLSDAATAVARACQPRLGPRTAGL